MTPRKLTRRKLEMAFQIVHYLIVETAIIILAIIAVWKLISNG